MIRSSGVHGILLTALAAASITSTAFATNYTITVDAKTKQGAVPHFWSRCVGTGGAQLCVDNDWKVAAKMGVKEAGFKAFRGHRILSYSNPISWNGSGTPTYNWTKFDQVYDFLVDSLGTVPVVELSAMPNDLKQGDEWSPPKSLPIWQDLIKNVVAHCIERYGMDRVKNWYWEVWNEWDYKGFWKYNADENQPATEQEYYAMYKAAVAGAVAAYPDIKIGGPSTTGAGGANGRVESFLNYCKTNNVKVDFVSNHVYAGGGSGPKANAFNVLSDSRDRSNAIKRYGKPLVSMNTEFNSSYSGQGNANPGDNLKSMDSHVNAPFVAKCIKQHLDDYAANTSQLPEVLSYWAISDVFDEWGTAGYIKGNNMVPFAGVFGLINYQGIPKATFNAYKMLHMMGTTRLPFSGIANNTADGVDGFATVDSSSSEVAVMVYNFFETLGAQTAVDNVALTVNNLPFANGKVEVTHYCVDSLHSNAYAVWLKNGSPKGAPTPQLLTDMRNASKLATLVPIDTIEYTGAAVNRTFDIRRQGLSLLLFRNLSPTATRSPEVKQVRPQISVSNSSISNSGKDFSVTIYSMNGKVVKTFTSTSSSIDLRNLGGNRGVYLVKIRAGSQLITTTSVQID